MSELTKIEWATHTFNPWEGCAKISPGCAHCYAEARNHRFGMDNWGKGKPRRRTSYWKQPLKWNREAGIEIASYRNNPLQSRFDGKPVERPRIFPSLCDWLDDEVPIEWLADFLKLIHDTPNIDWLLLTKRPHNWMSRCLDALNCLAPNVDDRDVVEVLSKCWIGVSCEDQQHADERIPELLKIPARVRFLSVEPLLGPVDVSEFVWKSGCEPHCGDKCSKDADCPIDGRKSAWVIVGGESGPKSRPCDEGWIRDIVKQCKAVGTPCFVKQLGANPVSAVGWTGPLAMIKHPKGGDPSEWPTDLRVREFPKA